MNIDSFLQTVNGSVKWFRRCFSTAEPLQLHVMYVVLNGRLRARGGMAYLYFDRPYCLMEEGRDPALAQM